LALVTDGDADGDAAGPLAFPLLPVDSSKPPVND
jgi:hypothetical protein